MTKIGLKPPDGQADQVKIPPNVLVALPRPAELTRGEKTPKSPDITTPGLKEMIKSTKVAQNTTPDIEKVNIRAEKPGISMSKEKETLSNNKICEKTLKIDLKL